MVDQGNTKEDNEKTRWSFCVGNGWTRVGKLTINHKLIGSNNYCIIFKLPCHSELKTEEGYSADIVRTYIPGDICPYNVRTISALCPHNISLVRHISFVRCCADIVPTLCGHCADIYLQGYMSAQCPHYILLRFSAHWKTEKDQSPIYSKI